MANQKSQAIKPEKLHSVRVIGSPATEWRKEKRMKKGSVTRKKYRDRLKVEDPVAYDRLFRGPGRRYYEKHKEELLKAAKEWQKQEAEDQKQPTQGTQRGRIRRTTRKDLQ